MGWTKGELIRAAYTELGISYDFDLDPMQIEIARHELDTMMMEWDAQGIMIGYAGATSPGSGGTDDDSGLPAMAFSAVIKNLAVRLAPKLGKQVMRETKTSAFVGYNMLLARSAIPTERMLNPTAMPAGAGYKTPTRPFFSPVDDDIDAGPTSELEFD